MGTASTRLTNSNQALSSGGCALSATVGRDRPVLSGNPQEINQTIVAADQYDDLDRDAARAIAGLLRNWSGKDATELAEAKASLAQTEYKAYEAGLRSLGRFAGATECYAAQGAHGAPDASWIFGERLWVVWEAKSEASTGSTISKRHALEASGHLAFIEDKRDQNIPTGSFTCYATPQSSIDHTAAAVSADDVYHVFIHVPRTLLDRIEEALANARRFGRTVDEAGVLSSLKAEDCLPTQWVQELTT